MNNNAILRRRQPAASRAVLRRRLLPLVVASCFIPAALANPLGPQVVNGNASFTSQGNILSITNTPGAIINWQAFFINPGEVTRFIQQNPNSSVLNRIVGQDPSQILGALQSNGRVFLVNPNGILFGQGAQVDVNGLVASTLNISNEDFINGRMLFKAGAKAASLKNQGAITTPAGGKVYLIAPNVENSGIITSPKGEVLLAAGHTVQLVDSLDPNLQVVLSAPEHEALNLGRVLTQGGTAGIFGSLIRQRGVVSADSAVVGENGKILFRATRDTLLETGSRTSAVGAGKGGDVIVLGDRVGMADSASIDVSGREGGGTVLLGGDYQGKNPSIKNASRTYFGQGAAIKADALDSGDGGKVIVWADDTTRAHGNISARGGLASGNGGFVETSGKANLEYRGRVDVSAPAGKNGTLLLDPATITIAGGVGNSALDGSINFADAGPATIYQSELEGLAPGTNIILEASDFITATGSFSNLVTLPSNSNLTLKTRNASSDGTGLIGINLVDSSNSSNLEIKTQGTGTITLQTGTGTSPQSATINVGKLSTQGGSISVNATGNVVLRGATTTNPAAGAGDISIMSGGYMTLGGGDIDARGGDGASGTVSLVSGGALAVQSGKTIHARNLKIVTAGGVGDGAGGAAQTEVEFLNIKNTTSGSINIDNTASTNNLGIDAQATGYGISQEAAGQAISIKTAPGTLLTVAAPIAASNGGAITLSADKMALESTISTTGSSGRVELVPVTSDMEINIGATDTTDGTTKLELNTGELNKITTPTLAIGNSLSGAIEIQQSLATALQNVSSAFSMRSGSTITQLSNATIDGGSRVQATGSSVSLSEANGTGVIAGKATAGDFKYTSKNGISIETIDGVSGIMTPAANNIVLASTHPTAGIGQSSEVVGGTLNIETPGPVSLSHINNSVTKVIADLNLAGAGTGAFAMVNSAPAGWQVGGIVTKDKSISLNSVSGTMTVSGDISAGVGAVTLNAPSLTIASNTNITGGTVTLAANGTSGAITQNIGGTVTGTTGLSLYGDGMTIDGTMIGGSNAGGQVSVSTNTSGRTVEIGDTTVNAGALSLTQGSLANINPAASGVNAGSFIINAPDGLVQFKGSFGNPGGMYPNIFAGSIGQDPDTVISGYLHAVVTGDINLPGANTLSKLGWSLTSSGANSKININTSTPTLYLMGAISAGSGGIDIGNSGGSILATDAQISSTGGSVKLSATSGLTIASTASDAFVKGTSGVNLNLGGDLVFNGTGSYKSYVASLSSAPLKVNFSNATEKVLFNTTQATTTTSDSSGFFSGGAPGSGGSPAVPGSSLIITGGNVGTLTVVPGTTSPPSTPTTPTPTPTQPSLDQCVIDPTQSGCSSVLPTMTQCTNAPATAGCSVVLPTLSQCTTAPTTNGCSAVLPSLSQCVSSPGTSGCTAVLPSLSQCTGSPATVGCSVVLPTLSQCTTEPTTAGCSVVLPALSQCTSAPSTAGCSVVLPTLSQCTSTPSAAGCNVVLPTIAQCTTAPSTNGCSAVLPTLTQCTAAPSMAGCSVILPSLSQCSVAPAITGCSAVLPTMAQCTSAPSTAGCSAVLPTLSQCTSTPSVAGCSAVLPTLSDCISNPVIAGCSMVLPTLAQCSASPTLQGCSVVVPIANKCTTNPSAEGCQTVLPPMSTITRSALADTVITTSNTLMTIITASSSESSAVSTQSQSPSGGGSTSARSDKKDSAKDDKKTSAGAENNGVKKNETAKKLYCN